ncbi:histidine phosphatase family protein [Roseobacter sinensis]|uniref:Histidine phosphatase family protein n=1 Tax=Roseobacter sinensis TaxID=2931391 RepID=A0ABT3BJD5_9RHOB|nr:histidine phosphatase family protein [Roseobacter sp. WL0113]MCV3273474.1 histidine phosphatase family protein [Roseobacter sp. WL0113]
MIRAIRTAIALCLAVSIWVSLAAPVLAQATPREIIAALREGGHVIYFRHAATTWSGVDRVDWPRERQRLLSEEGIADSRRIGNAFRRAAIPVGEVMASPFARCRDMAEIAFGRVSERAELLGLLSDDAGHPARIAFLQEQLSAPSPDGRNRILVSHRSNIAQVAGVSLGEGDAVILVPRGAAGFEILGVMQPQDWDAS